MSPKHSHEHSAHESHHEDQGRRHAPGEGLYPADLNPSAVPTAAEGVIYTCPMHPQIRRLGPGNCPICGMALEPLVTTTEEAPSAELIDMTRRF